MGGYLGWGGLLMVVGWGVAWVGAVGCGGGAGDGEGMRIDHGGAP